jgi:hypothetical protein
MLEDIGILIIAIVAVVAVFLAYWVVKQNRIENKKAIKSVLAVSEGQLLLDMLREYSSDTMSEAVQTLKNWQKEYKESYKTEFAERYKTKDLSVIPLNRARQLVYGYFLRMLKLHEAGYISESFCSIICNSNGTDVLFEAVEPFEEIVAHIEPNKSYNKSTFDNLRRLCQQRSK